MMEITKTCSKCEEDKPYSEYNADSRRKDGKRASCKQCDSAQKKAIRDANIDKYREANREANRAYQERKRRKKEE